MTYSTTPLRELRGLKGLWQYLITRSQLKAKIEIERERCRAYADHRDRLPANAELMDYEDAQGRRFWIRKNDPPAACLGPQLPLPAFFQVGSVPMAEIALLANDESTGETTP